MASPSSFELWLTLCILGLSAALVGCMVYLERRPRDLLKPRLFPTTPVMFIAMLVAVLALVHLLNIYGVHTGRGF